VVSQKFVAFVLRYLVCREFPKSRSFGSAEVRFAQDDRSFFDINIGDMTLVIYDNGTHLMPRPLSRSRCYPDLNQLPHVAQRCRPTNGKRLP
jgi:hypothetical protein